MARLDAFVRRRHAWPRRVPPELATFKHDLYLAGGGSEVAIGIATSDRFEGIGLLVDARHLYADLGLDFGPAADLHQRYRRPGTSFVVSVELTGDRPTIKAYVQEDAWGAGVCTVAQLDGPFAQIDAPPDARVGVVSVKQRGPQTRWRAYLGAATAEALRRLVPASASALPTEGRVPWGHYYATLRLSPDGPPRVGLNKVYNTIQLGFGSQVGAQAQVWGEIRALFAAAGRSAVLDRFTRSFAGGTVVPTAIAHDPSGVVDLYVATWARSGGA